MTASSVHSDTVKYLKKFDGTITIQIFDDREPKRRRGNRVIHNPVDFREILHLNHQGYGVFLMINEGDGKGRRKENVIRIRAFCADFDGQELPHNWLVAPSLIVESSPGKFHVYWFIAGEIIISNEAWNMYVRSIAKSVGSCLNDCDGINRVMRVPGFKHNKLKPFRSRIVEINENTYTLEEITEGFNINKQGDRQGSQAATICSSLVKLMTKLTDAKIGKRNNTLYQVACEAGKLVRRGLVDLATVTSEITRSALAIGLAESEISATLESGLQTGQQGNGGAEKRSLSQRLIEYLQDRGTEYWLDQSGNPYISVKIDDHIEHMPLGGRTAAHYLRKLVFDLEGAVLTSAAGRDVMALLSAFAAYSKLRYPVAIRVCHIGSTTYVDLCNGTWEVIQIRASGWSVISSVDCPVRFVRNENQLALPAPDPAGTLSTLLPLINADEDDRVLIVAWLLGAISGISPYPMLVIKSPNGTGKTSMMRLLKKIVDPSVATKRAPPKEPRDLYVAAQRAHILDYDNFSTLSADLSDTLCRIATGSAYTTRTLYADSDETVLQASRPLIINAISDIIVRPDLAERALIVDLIPICEEERLTESQVDKQFDAAYAGILGGLCTALATGLANLESLTVRGLPRMADFAKLVVAAEPALPWTAGKFLEIQRQSGQEKALDLLDNDPVAPILRVFIERHSHWEGTLSELLRLLSQEDETLARFTRSPRAFGDYLRRITTVMDSLGYIIKEERRSKHGIVYSFSLKV